MNSPHRETTLASAVAGEVRAEMARQRLTAVQVADAAGMTKGYLHRRLTEQSPFTLADLERLAAVLHVDAAHFLAPVPAAGDLIGAGR